jgi:nitrate/TMAO reductase-like tetraheme cytochrome c subunit
MRTERNREQPTRASELRAHGAAVLLSAVISLVTLPGAAVAEEGEDSCIECHSSSTFMVTNRKLYDYFLQWTVSIHGQEDVSCVDCHGGNPDTADKDRAHGGDMGEDRRDSAVNFRNIPRTCGECHDDIYEGFRESEHSEHVIAKKQEDQGPTCVTCHGSINVAVLNVNTVEEACSRCHNEETENAPENPQEARDLLNRLLAIRRYYRYITVRGEPSETKAFFESTDQKLAELSATWHTFDLDQIREETRVVLAALKEKREEVARAWKERRQRSEAETPR